MSQSSIHRSLAALRDVAGVHGSFVLRLTGELVDKDLPSVFHEELFVDVGARLSRFVETMALDGDEVASAILRFDEHRLHVTRFPQGLLAVITASDINTAALRMALTLTTRRLEPELAAGLAQPKAASAELAAPPASSPPPSVMPGSHGAPRMYRGRPIGG